MDRIAASCHAALYDAVKNLYETTGDLPFHGWHHVQFVHDKSAVFAADLNADVTLTQIAALVHDLNYLAEKGAFTHPPAGRSLRQTLLKDAKLSDDARDRIEDIVITAEIGKGHDGLSAEAKALSDADTLFKALPTTPILFASRYIAQTNGNIRKLAQFINDTQKHLFDEDLYFYSAVAKENYRGWAETNFQLWQSVLESFADPDIVAMLQQAGFNTE